MTITKTYKYKLYNSKHNKHLYEVVNIAASIWNHCIALHRRYYKYYGKSLSMYKLQKHITKLKKTKRYAFWNQLGSQAIQDITARIDKSYKAFFNHVKLKRKGHKSPPSFKKRYKYSSFTLKQAGYSFYGNNGISIMGRNYKYFNSRPIEGDIKTVTIKRSKLGEFYIIIVCKQEFSPAISRAGNAVGYDFGLKHFLTANDGSKIDSPEWHKTNLNKLRKAHRAVSRCKKGSNNRKRAIKSLNCLYEDISNKRQDWFFKLANEITTNNSVICIEDLNMDGMKRLWGRKISDIAFAEFVGILEWIAFKNGSKLVKMNRWLPSTKSCHVCGTLNEELSLKTRNWTCDGCGTSHDRDVNAAINIKTMGLATL